MNTFFRSVFFSLFLIVTSELTSFAQHAGSTALTTVGYQRAEKMLGYNAEKARKSILKLFVIRLFHYREFLKVR
jgi:hypothetical protein